MYIKKTFHYPYLTSRRSSKLREWQYAFLKGPKQLLSRLCSKLAARNDKCGNGVKYVISRQVPWQDYVIITFKCCRSRAYVLHLYLRSAWSGRFNCPCCFQLKVNFVGHLKWERKYLLWKMELWRNLWKVAFVTNHEVYQAGEVVPQKLWCSSNKSCFQFLQFCLFLSNLTICYTKVFTVLNFKLPQRKTIGFIKETVTPKAY